MHLRAISYLTAPGTAGTRNGNINDSTDEVEIAGPNTPAATQFRQRAEFGSLWTFGLKGTF